MLKGLPLPNTVSSKDSGDGGKDAIDDSGGLIERTELFALLVELGWGLGNRSNGGRPPPNDDTVDPQSSSLLISISRSRLSS